MGQARLRAKTGNDFNNQVTINMKLNTWNNDKNTYLICKDDNEFPHTCIVLNPFSTRYKNKTAYQFFRESGANQIAIRVGLTIEERANDNNRLLAATKASGHLLFVKGNQQGVNQTLLSQVLNEGGDFAFMLPAQPSVTNGVLYFAKPALDWDDEMASSYLRTCLDGIGASSYRSSLETAPVALRRVFKH